MACCSFILVNLTIDNAVNLTVEIFMEVELLYGIAFKPHVEEKLWRCTYSRGTFKLRFTRPPGAKGASTLARPRSSLDSSEKDSREK